MLLLLLLIVFASCLNVDRPNSEMIDLLAVLNKKSADAKNMFSAEARLKSMDSLLEVATDGDARYELENLILLVYLELGKEEQAVKRGEALLKRTSFFDKLLPPEPWHPGSGQT